MSVYVSLPHDAVDWSAVCDCVKSRRNYDIDLAYMMCESCKTSTLFLLNTENVKVDSNAIVT